VTTLSAVVADARSRLAAAGLPDATIEARILIGGVLGLTATDVFVRGDREIGGPELEKIAEAIGRRLKREPVHRILGEREFHGMVLKLSPETLEPRPDTEILVDAILPYVRQFVASRGEVRILDLGTGTGAILLALLKALTSPRQRYRRPAKTRRGLAWLAGSRRSGAIGWKRLQGGLTS
jgi:release factor glutamine methyltransferase